MLMGCTGVPVVIGPSVTPSTRATETATDPSVSPQFSGIEPTAEAGPIRYVALGDSYTIGTSVMADQRWPNQLVQQLRPDYDLQLAANLGVNGYTSADLITYELPQLESLDAGFLSLLIGVNDVVQKVPAQDYRDNLESIFASLLAKVPADRIFVVSTPDYTLTPQGAAYGDPTKQSERIERFNEILSDVATEKGILYVDISPVADQVTEDPTLVASDGLHPSGKQYAGWVEIIAAQVRAMLAKSP